MTEFFEIRRMKTIEPRVCDELVKLMAEHADSQGYDFVIDKANINERIMLYANEPHACLLVAYNENYGGVIGYILGHWFEEDDQRIATIKEFYLAKRARRKGIPRNYLRRFIRWAIENDCDGVEFRVLTGIPSLAGLVSILEHNGFEMLYKVYSLNLREAQQEEAGGETDGVLLTSQIGE